MTTLDQRRNSCFSRVGQVSYKDSGQSNVKYKGKENEIESIATKFVRKDNMFKKSY